MKTLTQEEEATPGQLRQIHRVASDAVEKVLDQFGLSKESAQNIHAHGDELVEAIRAAVVSVLKKFSVSAEEVSSSYGYFSGYTKPKSITEQVKILRKFFPGIGFANERIIEAELPKNAEGWFVVPEWQSIALTYSDAVQKVLDLVKETRNDEFFNCRHNDINPYHLRQSARSINMLYELGLQQSNDFLLLPAQLGLLHRGRSAKRARQVFSSKEFGIGVFAAGIILLTHPERLNHQNDLFLDCLGDEFHDPKSEGSFDFVPFFHFEEGMVGLDAESKDFAVERSGSASFILP